MDETESIDHAVKWVSKVRANGEVVSAIRCRVMATNVQSAKSPIRFESIKTASCARSEMGTTGGLSIQLEPVLLT